MVSVCKSLAVLCVTLALCNLHQFFITVATVQDNLCKISNPCYVKSKVCRYIAKSLKIDHLGSSNDAWYIPNRVKELCYYKFGTCL